jgi:hypothetical protein
MRFRLRYPVKIGKVKLPKGMEGVIVALSNAQTIRDTFPNLTVKDDGTYYIVKFPDIDECLLDKSQIDLE